MPQKLLFVFSRVFFLASIVIFQLMLAYKTTTIEFAYISFGFTLLSIAMIAFTFGFNQFLMYQYSRESTLSLDELFNNLFKIFMLNGIIVAFLIFIFLQFYSSSYTLYGVLFSIIALLLSFRDYFNIPYIIEKRYKEVSISNFLVSMPFYTVTISLFFLFEKVRLHNFIIILIVLLFFFIFINDYKKHHYTLSKKWKQLDILNDYKKTFAFGISVFLFTIYYQLSNILLPVLETENVVATFGVIFIYLGIIYTFLNIVFNQVILPHMYTTYKQNISQYHLLLQKYKFIFFIGGISISMLSLSLYFISDTVLFSPITQKYPEFFNGIAYVSLGIFARYIATVYSGNLNVIGLISLKVKIQLVVTLISTLLTYYLIVHYSFAGACIAYSLTETLLLFSYITIGALYVKKA